MLAAVGCAPADVFTTRLGAPGIDVDDQATGIATDGSGNVYVVGHTSGSFPGFTNAGGSDVLVIKLDNNGVPKWTEQLGTAGEESATGIATDASGNVYVVGHTSDSFPGFTNAGMKDVFVVKLDGDGAMQWLQQIGTAGVDEAGAIATDGSGDVYVAGSTEGSFPGFANAGSIDAFALKLSADGVQQWIQQPGTRGDEWANDVAMDGSGNVFVAGSTTGIFPGFETGGGRLVIKYDGNGVQQWLRQAAGPAVNDIATDSSGNLYVTGNTKSGIAWRLSLAKLDGDGALLWGQSMGQGVDVASTRVAGVATDSGGNVLIAGHTDENLEGSTNAGGVDLLVVKLASDGTRQWTRQAGTSGTESATGVAVDGQGNVFAAGYTRGRFPSAEDYDIVLMKYGPDGDPR